MVNAVKIRKDIDAPDFPAWLKAAVEADGRKPEVIAVAADISSGYLYRLMKGVQPTVSAEIVAKLEEVLGVKYFEGDRDG